MFRSTLPQLQAVLGKCFLVVFFLRGFFRIAYKLIPPALLCQSFQSKNKLFLWGFKHGKERSRGKSAKEDRVVNQDDTPGLLELRLKSAVRDKDNGFKDLV